MCVVIDICDASDSIVVPAHSLKVTAIGCPRSCARSSIVLDVMDQEQLGFDIQEFRPGRMDGKAIIRTLDRLLIPS